MSGHAHGREGVAPLGRPRVHLRRTDSTNDRARELAIAGAPHGTLVTASEQTAGRGRQGRRWSAPADSSLLMSLVLRAGEPGRARAERPPELLPLIAAVAVCDVAGDDARIKWPNDIVLERPQGLAKLAGILAEGRPQQGWAVLGIGLNVAVEVEELPAELRTSAATMGRPADEI
ncbi:MAG TPA: biotin--[acetyl-CoA-carboxylase] ligase, partial [Solirubrobacteraceae bacterium]|nr:biotin--[acetyl-CoA-carboxylase] ligase [Solirubrobacteraceae bacterium]